MLNWLKKWRQPKTTATVLRAHIIPRDQHSVSRKSISSAAVKTLYRLHDAGYDAYLIGGGVRDVLLGLHPKDFDVATNATPEQVKSVFGAQCQLIGRRFRLAHVRWGREIIEVATFRAGHDEADEDAGKQNDDGRILRDNVWGTIEQDAARRDFTINAIYYRIADFSLWDFAHGINDLNSRTLRLIGHPETRYREDPVRMLRAVRFAAKLDFTIAAETAKPIASLSPLLSEVSSHRLFDESQKLLASGHSQAILHLLEEHSLFAILFPEAAEYPRDALWQLTARNTDSRIQSGSHTNPGFFYAALLWGAAEQRAKEALQAGEAITPAWQQAAIRTLSTQHQVTAIPKYVAATIRAIWELQPRLENPRAKQVELLQQNERFRAAYDFLLLREQADEQTHGMGEWWTRWQSADPGLQAEMLRGLNNRSAKPGTHARKGRRRPRRPSAT